MNNEIERAIGLIESIMPSCDNCAYKEITKECDDTCGNPERKVLLEVAIQALREKLEREKEPDEWIPCSERMPEDAGNYLCWQVFYDDEIFAINYYDHSCDDSWDEWGVTHWIKLPGGPKEVEL